jgi:hypothetical protein
VGLLLLLTHYLLHSNILYTQHTTHQLIFVQGGKPEDPETLEAYRRKQTTNSTHISPEPAVIESGRLLEWSLTRVVAY